MRPHNFKPTWFKPLGVLFVSMISISCSETVVEAPPPTAQKQGLLQEAVSTEMNSKLLVSEEPALEEVLLVEEPPAAITKRVTLKTSDPRVTIIDISSPWRTFDAIGLDTPELSYQVDGDDRGFECEIESFRLFTSNKAVIVPGGNICESEALEIDINWPEYIMKPVVLKDEGFRWGLDTLPPTEAFPFEIDVVSYSISETDNVVMSAECARGSGTIKMTFQSAAIVTDSTKESPTISIVSNDANDPYLYRFASKWDYIDMPDGFLSVPSIYDIIDHPVFSEFEKGTGFDLLVKNESEQALRIDTKADQNLLENFMTRCGPHID